MRSKRSKYSILQVQIYRRNYDNSGITDIIKLFDETFSSNRATLRACKGIAETVRGLKADEARTGKPRLTTKGGVA